MDEMKLGEVESRFADIIWKNEPLTTRELVEICSRELDWKRTTTYTVLKKLSERGIFICQDSVVRSLVKREEFYSIQSERFVEQTFSGSLPAFIAAFTSRKKPTKDELDEIRRMIDSYKEE